MITIAIPSFPGNNCEVESIRSLHRVGIEPLFFRWNDDREKIKNVDGFFIPGGFSYEDRGRAGMVAGRDSLLDEIGRQAENGKAVIGNCNGAQILVESGIIPIGKGLQMCLAHNLSNGKATGFINEWVWVKPVCKPDRCVTSNWQNGENGASKPIHMPIAHGEGRFTTKDLELLKELEKNDQLAFKYCDEEGNVSENSIVTPNGSVYAVAGICNLAGNVVALMPHPERTRDGDPYFRSLKDWIEKGTIRLEEFKIEKEANQSYKTKISEVRDIEIFIDTIITNNEEATVEKEIKKDLPNVSLKQFRYISSDSKTPEELLGNFSIFNSNKEIAYIRSNGLIYRWNADSKKKELCEESPFSSCMLLRIDEPDTGAEGIGGGKTGICYALSNITFKKIVNSNILTIFANPHSSTLYSLA